MNLGIKINQKASTDADADASAQAEAEALAEATVEAESMSMVELEAAAGAEASVEATATVSAKAKVSASAEAEYKSDALDELLEDSLFKKKKPDNSPESQVDQALHASVSLKDLGLTDEKKVVVQEAPEPEAGSTPDPEIQASKDSQVISKHLSTYAGGQKLEKGSSILYGALGDADLDLGEAKIPSFTPPGMPDVGAKSQLYGTSMAPASPWAIGVAEASNNSPDLSDVGSLNDQSTTLISAQSYVRGGNKYDEQAEDMLDNEDEDRKNNVKLQAALAQQKRAQQEEESETEDVLAQAFSSMKTDAKVKTSVGDKIKEQQDLEYIVAFGDQ